MITSRLRLRPFTLEDAAEMYALNADPEVMRYVPDLPFEDVAAARRFLEAYLPIYASGYGRLAVIRREDTAFLGWCGLKKHEDGAVDLGYRFHRRYWGIGYATEAAMACRDHAFTVLGLDSIYAHAAHDNLASQRVLTKIGMRYSGEFQEPDWEGVAFTLCRADLA